MMERYALIMAAGEGRRAGTDIPKQFVKLLGIPMLWWSVLAFHRADHDTKIMVVLHPGFFAEWDIMMDELPEELKRGIDVQLIAGGRSRAESVSHGLMEVPDNSRTLVAVHDAARPMVTPEIISRSWECAEKFGAAVPVWPIADSLRELTAEGSKAVDRSRFVSAQTPQTFKAELLHEAYKMEEKPVFTDDASRVDALGRNIELFEGAASNIKVTNPTDFIVAEALLKNR